MRIQYLLSSSPVKLREALIATGKPTGTIEAEYGDDTVVEGSHFTLAHHKGPYIGKPAPSSFENGFARLGSDPFNGFVGLSHIDLDTAAGAAAVEEVKPNAPSFWELVEFYDTKGLHKAPQAKPSEEDLRRLYAYLAWDSENKVYANRDGEVSNVTANIGNCLNAIDLIVANNNGRLLRLGDYYREDQARLNIESFKGYSDGVILRESNDDVNHLYSTPSGDIVLAVVTFKPKKKKITLSFADPPLSKNAIQILQEKLGSESGGHEQIAGSPRGKECSIEDALAVMEATIESLKAKS